MPPRSSAQPLRGLRRRRRVLAWKGAHPLPGLWRHIVLPALASAELLPGLRRCVLLLARKAAQPLQRLRRSVCRHQRLRDHCAECNNFLCEVEVCPRQGHRFSSAQSLLGRSKHGDNPRAVTKSKELEVHQALRDAQIAFEYQHYLPFRGCGRTAGVFRAIRAASLGA